MRHPLLRFFAFYWLFPWHFALSTALIAGINLVFPLSAYMQGVAIHELEIGRAVVRLPGGGWDAHRAWMWVAVLIAFGVASRGLQYLASVAGVALGQRLLTAVRARIFAKIQSLDAGFFHDHGAGEIIARSTRDCDKVRDAVASGYRNIVELVVLVLANLGLIWFYSWILAVVPTLLLAGVLLANLRRADALVRMKQEADEAGDRVTQDLSEGIHGVRVIKAFTLERAAIRRLDGNIATFVATSRAAAVYALKRLPASQVVLSLGHPWVLGCGAWLVANGELNRGELIAALMLIQSVVFRAESSNRLLQTFADARASAARVWGILDAEPAIRGGSAALPPEPWSIRLEQASARTPAGAAVLDRVDLELRPGEVVALVGMTGSGKSTLAALLPRLRDPQGGRVLIGGGSAWVDARELPLDPLRQRVQVVAQDSFLFSDSLAGNLRIGDPKASDAELVEAMRLASAEDVLAGLPQGLASRIGERGVTLSGGQRQRVCIARALLARPAILCLDDATSALDALTERRILGALRGSGALGLARCAVLLITSRLASVQLADRVLLLADGRIAASGSHDHLAATSAAYRRLLALETEDAA